MVKKPKNTPTKVGQRVKLKGRPFTGEITLITDHNWVNVAWDWDCLLAGVEAQKAWDDLPVEYASTQDEYYGRMTKGKRPTMPAWGWHGLEELEVIQWTNT